MVIFYTLFFFHIFILGYRNVDQAAGFCLICVEPWVGPRLLLRTSALIPALAVEPGEAKFMSALQTKLSKLDLNPGSASHSCVPSRTFIKCSNCEKEYIK